jgi:hypothetical protein
MEKHDSAHAHGSDVGCIAMNSGCPDLAGRGVRVARVLYLWLRRLIVAAAFIQLGVYLNDVHTRWSKADTCRWSHVKDRDNEPYPRPPYVARYCLVERDRTWLQLYDASGRELLAERMYFDLDKGSFFWAVKPDNGGVHSLMYQSSSSDSGYGAVTIPPTRLDRLLAALP